MAKNLEQENEELRSKLALAEAINNERAISDKRYAFKRVETIIYFVIGIFALATLYFIFNNAGIPKP